MKDLNAFQTMLDAKDVNINRKQDLPLIISSIQYMKFNQREKQVSTVVLEGYLYAGVSKQSFCGFDVF